MEIPTVTTTRLVYQHKVIVDLIDGLNDELIRRRPAPGKWSIFEHMVHLQTYQHEFLRRIELIRSGANPVFERYRAESDPLFVHNCTRSTREIVQDLLTVRKEMASRFPQYSNAELRLSGTHCIYGTMTLPEWLNFFLLHEAHHLFVIFSLSASLKEDLRKSRAGEEGTVSR